MPTTREVLDDHLERQRDDDVDGDARANFAEDCVLLTTYGVFRGHDGLRESAALLRKKAPETEWTFNRKEAEQDMGFLEWSATSEKTCIDDGADSYLIRDGKIRIMTIHYTVKDRE